MKYALIKSYQACFSVAMMCRLLEVSRSAFYAWLKQPESKRAQRRAILAEAVDETFHSYKKRYGAPRIAVELNENGVSCSLNHVAKLLNERGLRARNGKGFKYRARIESKTNVADNLLKRDFEAKKPNLKWVSDITYIRVGRDWLYLAVVMDLFSRKVIGWSLADHMREELVLDAFAMAISGRETKADTLIHSDRGVQYRGHDYQSVLQEHGIQCSMSRKGNCWDNAAMEAFFGRLKVELIYAENYTSVEKAKTAIFEYIEMFYNRKRRHSAIGYCSPSGF